MKKGRRFGDIVSNVYLILLAIVAVFPLLWLLVSAFKSSSEMLNNPTKIWPIQWTLENFKTVLFTLKFTVNIRNSLIIAGSTTVVAIIISSLAAYGVVRFFPKLGNVMTKILVTTYMFPSIMLVIPYAMVMAKLRPFGISGKVYHYETNPTSHRLDVPPSGRYRTRQTGDPAP